MSLPLEALTIAALLAAPPTSTAHVARESRSATGYAVATGETALSSCLAGADAARRGVVPGLVLHPVELGPVRTDHSGAWHLGARLGAALAWDLADLPRHRSDRRGPLDPVPPGAIFMAGLTSRPAVARDGGAIGHLIARWNRLYPAFVMEGMNDH